MSKISDLLERRKPRTKTIRLVLDGDSTVELELAKNELRGLKLQEKIDGSSETLASKVPILERKIQELEAEILKDAVEFTFTAIGRGRFDELKAKFPPTAAQWEIYREASKANPLIRPPTYDGPGFAPVLIAEATVDPEMSLKEAQRLWDELSDGEAAQVFEGAWDVNMEVASVPLSATGTDEIQPSDESSITQRVTESLGPSMPEGS